MSTLLTQLFQQKTQNKKITTESHLHSMNDITRDQAPTRAY